ncbi:MAG: Ig-like domain-containing protein [Candidatus Micrarchaeota archaeon]|nr:Ig-like domain-containing protein [Candidatus Micrarchaeota archaeon]
MMKKLFLFAALLMLLSVSLAFAIDSDGARVAPSGVSASAPAGSAGAPASSVASTGNGASAAPAGNSVASSGSSAASSKGGAAGGASSSSGAVSSGAGKASGDAAPASGAVSSTGSSTQGTSSTGAISSSGTSSARGEPLPLPPVKIGADPRILPAITPKPVGIIASIVFRPAIIPSAVTLYVGNTQQFLVYIYFSNGTVTQVPNSVLKWSTTGSIGAATGSMSSAIPGGIGSVDKNGLFTALAAGNGTVTATYTGPLPVPANVPNSVTAQVQVLSNSPPPPPGNSTYTLLVSPASASLLVGATQQFVGQLYDANGTYVMNVPNSDLSWLSSNTAVGTIDSLGVFTALSQGNASVKAVYVGTSFTNVTSQNTASVTVGSSPPPPPGNYTLLVSPASASLLVGATQQFIGQLYDSNGTYIANVPNSDLSWMSSNTAVGTIDPLGMFSALLVSPASATLLVGATQQFIGQLYDSNGTYIANVPNSDLSWMSSNTAVGTIDPLGMFSAGHLYWQPHRLAAEHGKRHGDAAAACKHLVYPGGPKPGLTVCRPKPAVHCNRI